MFREAAAGLLILSTLGAAASFAAGPVELLHQTDAPQISETASGDLYGGDSFRPPDPASVSADGRYAVFLSGATNLVSGQRDVNGPPGYPGEDVFLTDLATGAVTLVSHALGQPATTGNHGSSEPLISADGRWIVFRSAATDLAPGQQPSRFPFFDEDVLLYDRVTATTTLVASTSQEDAGFRNLAISADGRYVAYDSDAGDLVPGGHPAQSRAVYLYDRVDRSTRLVSHLPGAPLDGPMDYAGAPRMSADGRYVVFVSGSADLLPGQITGPSAILYDRATGALSLVGPANTADISADGKVVAFSRDYELRLYDRTTGATDLVTSLAEATNFYNFQRAYTLSADGRYLAFLLLDQVSGEVHPMPMVYDRISRAAIPVSRTSAAPPGTADTPRISADGRLVVFGSGDTGWIAGQTGNTSGIYLFDRAARKTSMVSHAATSLTALGNGASYSPAIAAGSSRVLFLSQATDLAAGLADLNRQQDLFACDVAPLDNRAVTLRAPDAPSLSPVADGRGSSVSADGRYVAVERATPGMDAYNGQVDVLLYDAMAKTTVLVDHVPSSAATPAKGASFLPVLSADGRTVAFYSNARNLVPGANAGGVYCLFLFDRITGAVTFVARTQFIYGARDEGVLPRISLSADGRRVAFVSDASDVVPGQQEHDPAAYPPTHDVFLFDRDSGAITLVSHAASVATLAGERDSDTPLLSADGRWLLFVSAARDLLPGLTPDFDGYPGAYLYDRLTGALTLLSHPRSDPSTISSLYATPAMSADGRYIALATAAPDLDPNVNALGPGIYLYDRAAGSYTRVASFSQLAFGPELALSGDGRILALTGGSGLSLYDRVARTLSMAARTGVDRGSLALSADGRYAVFSTDTEGLVPGLIRLSGWGGSDIYLYDRVAGTTVLVNQWQGSAVTTGGWAENPHLSAGGQRVVFTSAIDLVAGDYNRQPDAYLFSLSGGSTGGGPVTVPPCILFDTRRPADGPALRSNVARVVKATGVCGVPATAKRVTVKLTVFQGTGKGNVRLYPGDLSAPSAGILRFSRGQTASAVFDLPVASNGAGTLTLLPFVAGNGTAGVSVEIDGYTP
jgi:Tol biopolymer transport system component